MSAALESRARARVAECVDIIRAKVDPAFAMPRVEFFRKSKTAGTANFTQWRVRLSLDFLERDEDRMHSQTIPHELAHLLTDAQAQAARAGRLPPHGREWKRNMRNVFGLEPDRCHSMDSKGIGRALRVFAYRCACGPVEFTIVRHRRSLQAQGRGQPGAYRCRTCREIIVEA